MDGDERMELAGKTLLPGLFDCHTHIAISTIDLMRALQAPLSYVLPGDS